MGSLVSIGCVSNALEECRIHSAQSYTPRNYIRFLDYAAERIFLQKVGGGFIFIHRLLMEHFAAMDQGGEGED